MAEEQTQEQEQNQEQKLPELIIVMEGGVINDVYLKNSHEYIDVTVVDYDEIQPDDLYTEEDIKNGVEYDGMPHPFGNVEQFKALLEEEYRNIY